MRLRIRPEPARRASYSKVRAHPNFAPRAQTDQKSKLPYARSPARLSRDSPLATVRSRSIPADDLRMFARLSSKRVEIRVRGKLPALPVPGKDGESWRGPGRVGLSVHDALDLGQVADDERRAGLRCVKLRNVELVDSRQVREVLLLSGAAAVGALDLNPGERKRCSPARSLWARRTKKRFTSCLAVLVGLAKCGAGLPVASVDEAAGASTSANTARANATERRRNEGILRPQPMTPVSIPVWVP